MATKLTKKSDPIAMSRIEYGEIVDGVKVVKVFEPGDVVSLNQQVMDQLVESGAVSYGGEPVDQRGYGVAR